MPRSIPVVLAATLAACSGDDVPAAALRLELPVRDTHRAALIAVDSGQGTTLHALAIDPAEGITMPFVHAIDASVSVTALLYEETLEMLRLQPGDVPIAGGGRSLPDPDTIERAELRAGDRTAAFSRLIDLPPNLAAVRIASPFACADFELRAIPLGTTESVKFVLAIGTGVLVSTGGAQRFFVTPDAATPLLSPPTDFYDAFLAEDGAIWLAGEAGEVWRGTLAPRGCETGSEPCQRLDAVVRARAMFSSQILALDGPRTAEPDELYVVSFDGELVRMDFANNEQRELYNFVEITHPVRRILDVAWIRPNEVVAVSDNERAPVRFVDDRARVEPELEFPDELTVATHIPEFGTIIGSFCGRISRNQTGDAQDWVHVAGKPSTNLVRGLVAYEDGFAYAEESGLVGQWTPGDEYCPAYGALAANPERLYSVAVVGRDLVAGGSPENEDAPSSIRWMLRR